MLATAEETVRTAVTANPKDKEAFFWEDTPRKEQMPKNWLKTTLLTRAVVTMMRIKLDIP